MIFTCSKYIVGQTESWAKPRAPSLRLLLCTVPPYPQICRRTYLLRLRMFLYIVGEVFQVFISELSFLVETKQQQQKKSARPDNLIISNSQDTLPLLPVPLSPVLEPSTWVIQPLGAGSWHFLPGELGLNLALPQFANE